MIGFFIPIPAAADSSINQIGEPLQVLGVTQQDQNGDGAPDVAVIDCAFATAHDQVLVYDQNGDMQTGSQWEQITDFQDDVWVFDVGADGTAQLIVDFERENGKYIALVYDDLDEDKNVEYRVVENKIKIEESRFWHVKVETEQYWSITGAATKISDTFLIDGYNGLRYGVGGFTGIENKGVDGELDWQVDIGDKNDDGIIDYELARAISPFLISYPGVIHKGTIFSQENPRQPELYTNTVFWSFLIDKTEIEGNYFDHVPVIAMNWTTGAIDSLGILGYPTEAGYHIFDRLPLEMSIVNTVDWENPMAYYDMAADQDGWPELQVRFQAAVPNDPYFPSYPYQGSVKTPNVEVDYTWDANNDNLWDYKFNMGANYAINEVVEFPDFSINSVPYEEIIPWVRNK
ncbi:MAG: hypothetical protein LUQ65_10710, partial [Candidatus Helarchaeota archaeon]|nr:hypothetical protein [Candidatus Helarchaeota archaeon]